MAFYKKSEVSPVLEAEKQLEHLQSKLPEEPWFGLILSNKKGVEAILIWPSDAMEDKKIIKKICIMSKKEKIPVFVMQEGWTEQGAMVEFKSSGTMIVVVNEQVRSYMNFPIAANDY